MLIGGGVALPVGAAGHLVEIVVGDALGALAIASYTYDANGHMTSFTDGRGNTSSFVYTNGRLTSSTDANGAVTTYTYDRAGNRTP